MCQGAPTKFLGDHADHSGKHYAVDLVGAPVAAKAADDTSTPKASVAGPVQNASTTQKVGSAPSL